MQVRCKCLDGRPVLNVGVECAHKEVARAGVVAFTLARCLSCRSYVAGVTLGASFGRNAQRAVVVLGVRTATARCTLLVYKYADLQVNEMGMGVQALCRPPRTPRIDSTRPPAGRGSGAICGSGRGT